MPRPPAKRARRPPQKPAQIPVQKDVAEEVHAGATLMSGALGWSELDTERNASMHLPTALEASRGTAQRTPNRTTGTHEIGSSKQPATASRFASRGQPFASALRRAGEASAKFRKISATPGFDSSMLSSFRPRPRQPSILHLMDDGDDGSDFDSEMFLDGFDPEDASTPLTIHKRNALPVDALPPTPSPRKSTQAHNTSGKKRKLFAVEIPAFPQLTKDAGSAPSPSPDPDPVPEPGREEADNGDSDSDDDSIPLPDPPDIPASSELANTTMAPPVSSSVANSPVKQLSRASKSAERLSSTKSAHQPQISTSALRENLLPARRRRRLQAQRGDGHEFDLDSDVDGEDTGRARTIIAADEDELSYMPAQKSRKTGRDVLKSNKQRANKQMTRKGGSKLGTRGKGVGAKRATEKPLKGTGTTKERLSKPRRGARGKENDVYEAPSSDSDEQDSETTPNPKDRSWRENEELVRQAKKFAEIDKWSMEFEEVTAESSSPFR